MSAIPNDPRAFARALLADTDRLRQTFVLSAQSLCDEYLDRRGALQRRRIQATARHVSVEGKLATNYAPLLLRVRQHKDVIEIYWCTINHGRYRAGLEPRRTHPHYLARGKRADMSYALPGLLKHARAWELDLVVEMETRAARLRRCLRECSRLAMLFRALQRLTDHKSAPTAAAGGGKLAPAQPDEAPHPGVMPTPPRSSDDARE